ncbi:MAG: hypothetical protein LUO93_05070 [Methanomicrobiales archaeon]|nr:hypothetical protein [Methanomicrobiales archaeon]
MDEAALLVMEGPWWTPEQKPKRPTVLPFLEGLEQYRGDFNIYYSNFYEKRGFDRALQDDLSHTREERLYLYIAAHGGSRTIGGIESESGKIGCAMHLTTLFKGIKKIAHHSSIEGVLIGSCSIGCNVQDFIRTMKDSPLIWVFGYTCEIEWVASTLVDLSILEHLINLNRPDIRSRGRIVEAFSRALSRFNPSYPICKVNEKTSPLVDAISLVVRPRASQALPREATTELRDKLGWSA